MAVGIAAATALAGQALGDARELSRLLRPPVLDDLGLGPALRWLVRTLGQQTGLQVALEVEVGEPARLAADLETLVFRVVQEGLTNVLKHAGVERAEVAVRVVGDRLELSIADGGRGFDPDETLVGSVADGGSGLRGIQDRVELFGGRFALRSGAGKGTAIEVAVPMSGFAPGEGGDAP
jgi:signal transduction histidine kinase